MNLTSRKARTWIALCSGAAVVAGGAVVAVTASAAGSLTLYPSATAVTVVNNGAKVDGGKALAAKLANATYAVKVTSEVTSLNLKVDEAPTAGAKLFYNQALVSAGTGPAAAWESLTTGGTDLKTGLDVAKGVFLTADVPGTYKVSLIDPGASAGTDDDVTSTITLTVKDAHANTAGTTADDWVPTVTLPESLGIGAPATATVSFSPLATVDARGTSSGIGVLASSLAAVTALEITGSDDDGGGAADLKGDLEAAGSCSGATVCADQEPVTAAASSGSRSILVGKTGYTGTITATAYYDRVGDGTFSALGAAAADTVNVTGNNVTALDFTSTDVVGDAKQSGSDVAVRAGVSAVTYVAEVTDADADKSGNVVYFTLTPGTNAPVLTATGTQAAAGIFTVLTDADGKASLTVTSSVTTAGTDYAVHASSNGEDDAANSGVLDVAYSAPAVDEVEITNTTSSLYPPITQTSVVLSGKLYDQFDAVYQPDASLTQQASVEIPTGTAVGFATITGGQFSYTYTPGTAPTAGSTTTFTLKYGAKSDAGTISWTTATDAGSVTLDKPNADATGIALSTSATLDPGQLAGATDFGNLQGEVTGIVKDGTGAGMAFKSVTVTGSEGVYFSNFNDGRDLAATATATADSSGNYGGVFAFFTKAGDATITVTSGSATATRTVTTEVGSVSYGVRVDDVNAVPGNTVIVTGAVRDAFDNVVPNVKVDLSLGASTLGALGASTVTTNSEGVFSTTFLAGSNQSGTATLTATAYDVAGGAGVALTANPTAHADWANVAKMTIPAGTYRASSTVTVTEDALDLTAPATRKGAGTVTLTGTAPASARVEIYAKATGMGASFGWVKTVRADAEGAYEATVTINKSTTFIAKKGSVTSDEAVTEIVTLASGSTKVGGGSVTISGEAIPGSAVKLYKRVGSGSWALVTTLRAGSTTGAFSKSLTVNKTTSFMAKTEVATSSVRTIKVKSVVTFVGDKALGSSKYLLKADGGPNGEPGTLRFEQYTGGAWKLIKEVAASKYGGGSYTWSTTKGTKKIRVFYTAPGTTKSAAVTKSVVVR